MVKSNVKKIIICLVAILLVVLVGGKTLAKDATNSDDLRKMFAGEKTNSASPDDATDIDEGTKNNTLNDNGDLSNKENGNLGNIENTNGNLKNENKPTTAPDTGLEDYSSIIFIAIFAVSAIYAYKKIREYNV